MNTEANILDRAADLIEPEGAWTQGTDARASDGRPVAPTSRSAMCWCAGAAISRECGGMHTLTSSVLVAAHVAAGVADDDFLYKWNDAPERTQGEVVAALRKAAQTLRDQAGEEPT